MRLARAHRFLAVTIWSVGCLVDIPEAVTAPDGAPNPPGTTQCTGPGCDGGVGSCAADLATSQQHCGACNHDCLGGACKEGRCQPLRLTPDDPRLRDGWAIVVDADELFWVTATPEEGRVFRMRAGCTAGPSCLDQRFQAQSSPVRDVAVDRQHVYAMTEGGRIVRVTRSGAATAECNIATGDATANGIVVDTKFAYWARERSGSVHRAAKECPSATDATSILYPATPGAAHVRIFDGRLVWGSRDVGPSAAPGAVYSAPANGGGPVTKHLLEAGPVTTVAPVAGSNNVVVGTGELRQVDRPGAVFLLDLTPGGRPNRRLGEEQTTVRYVAADLTHAYWTVPKEGLVRRARLEGGPAETVASMFPHQPQGLTVDTKAIYWVDFDADGAVWRLAK